MTGYVVHYSHGDNMSNMTECNITENNMTDSNMTDSDMMESIYASSTHAFIENLTGCYNYTFSVEATSEHLSGISKTFIFKLGMELQLMKNIITEPNRVSMNVFYNPTLGLLSLQGCFSITHSVENTLSSLSDLGA